MSAPGLGQAAEPPVLAVLMASIFAQTGDYQDFRVYIRDREGRYLARSSQGWGFTDDRSRAAVFLYVADQVAEQIARIGALQGLVLKEEPVPLHEIYETCDRCKEMAMPFMIHFEGNRFLCADCLRLIRPRRRRTAT